MKILNCKKQFVFSILVLGAIIFGFFFFKNLILKKDANATKIQKEWKQEMARREEIRSLNKSIEIINAQKSLLESHFAKSSNVVPFLNNLEDLGKQVGVSANISSVDIAKDGTGLEVSIMSEGSFESTYRFLTLLENTEYLLEFQSVNIQKIPTKENEISSNLGWLGLFKLKLLTFSQ